VTRWALVTDRLTRCYGPADRTTAVLRDVSCAVAPGEVVALLGPSGSGKTTFLSIAGGLLAPTAGRIWIGNVELSGLEPGARRAAVRGRVGFVFQRFLLLPELTALENAMLGFLLAAMEPGAAITRARDLLERLGLGEQLDAYPATLSAGEQQRVAVARAVGCRPALVLADEPTGSLDWPTGRAVVAALRELAVEHGSAVVIATHDDRVRDAAHRVLTLSDGSLSEAETTAGAA
jgi:putative ABC transport system ATP-binding protein